MKLCITLMLYAFRMIVIPAQFQDRDFAIGTEELSSIVQEASDYFNDQYKGATEFLFELAPTVTLSHKMEYYGANYPDRRDVLLHEAIREACNLSDDHVDFSLYDNDGDGYVDNVFVLLAGTDEIESGIPESIWPQQGYLRQLGGAMTLDGKHIDCFTVSTESSGTGFFCHEFAHALGLYDMYDTDGESSGGESPGLLNTSLMDMGCRNAGGNNPPNFNAIDYETLGMGTCIQLAIGSYTLYPINREGTYLKAETGNEGEYFLFECREATGRDASIGGSGLLIYHVDKSVNSAGYSDYYKIDLSAYDRWANNQVNCRPDRMCAYIVAACNESDDRADIFFPCGDNDSFGSDTSPAFRYWSGKASGLAVTDIIRNGDGSVSFNVIEPLVIQDIMLFQDAAIIQWSSDASLDGATGYTISWTDGNETFSAEAPAGTHSFTIDNLKPKTAYRFTISLRVNEHDIYSASSNFITKVYREGTYPYIYLNTTTRNVDGSFPIGAKIPLRVFNASDVVNVDWYFKDRRIAAGEDGYYTVREAGTLRAEIEYADGSVETIIKEIRL